MEHFVSRKAMDIDSLGSETIAQLYEAGFLKTIADIYELKKDDLLKIERMAEKSANNLLEGIEASKNIPKKLKIKYPELPWEEMYQLRNRVSHEYFGIDYEIIWDIVQTYLPKNQEVVSRIILLEGK